MCYAAIYMWAVVVHYYRPNGVPTGYIMIQTKHELQKRIDSRGKQISGAQSSTKHNLNGRSTLCTQRKEVHVISPAGALRFERCGQAAARLAGVDARYACAHAHPFAHAATHACACAQICTAVHSCVRTAAGDFASVHGVMWPVRRSGRIMER